MNANNGLITYLEPFFFCLTLIKGGQRFFAIKSLFLPNKLSETAHARQNEQVLLLSLNRSFVTETIT
jgi:hypothetical protein